jgi:hypothetical protein
VKITREDVETSLAEMEFISGIAQSVGIPLKDVVDGKPIPSAWWFDPVTLYYLPPGFTFRGGRA